METASLKTIFPITDFFVELSHCGDALSEGLLEELIARSAGPGPYEPVCARAELICGRSALEIPPRSRLAFVSGKNSIFTLGNDRYCVEPGVYTAALSFSRNRLTFQYEECSAAAFSASRLLLKWLCIKAAERRGTLCLHASSVHFRNNTILFCGHSGTGKSSSAWRLQRNGARVISDDVALIRNGECFSIGWKTHIVGDFPDRFGLVHRQAEYLRNPEQVENRAFLGINLVVFSHIWESDESRWLLLDLDSALNFLWEIYEREAGWNAYVLDKDTFLQLGRVAFANSRFCQFFAGRHEDEVTASLIGMVESVCTG